MEYHDKTRAALRPDVRPKHYYGDHVRRLFLIAGAIMIFTFPFYRQLINIPVWIAVASMLAIVIFSGMQNPRHHWTAILNTIISVAAFCTFVYKGANFYFSEWYADAPLFFWINQLLAFIFFFGIYYSVKSMRAPLAVEPSVQQSESRSSRDTSRG